MSDSKRIIQLTKYTGALNRADIAFMMDGQNFSEGMQITGARVYELCKGDKGDKGDTGVQGIQGPKGDKGNTGDQGIQGIQGPKGDKGNTGTQGPQGIQGPKGDKGDTGDKGPKGDKGETGAQGPQGDKGDKGDTGAQGSQGVQGIQGEKGDKGNQGNAFKIAGHFDSPAEMEAAFPDGSTVDGVFEVGTSTPYNYYYWDTVSSSYRNMGPVQGVKGDKGDTGEQGPQGIQGSKGDKGNTGDRGPKGDKGDAGEQGSQGIRGEKGDKGDAGADGKDGKNGHDWTVPDIDRVPDETDLSYESGGETVNYPIGGEVRYFDEESREHVFYKLFDIDENGAVWKPSGSGGIEILPETVNITLKSNQSSHTDLTGAVIKIKYKNQELDFIWENETVTVSVPGKIEYTVSVSDVEGYRTPESVPFDSIPGNTRSMELVYETTLLSVSVVSNQPAPDISLAGSKVIVGYEETEKEYNWSASAISVKVPTRAEYTVSVSGADGYKSPDPVSGTASGTAGSVTLEYKTERVGITASSTSKKITIKNKADGSVIKTLTSSIVPIYANVSFDVEYEVSIEPMSGYATPEPVSFTASLASRSVAFTYVRIEITTITFPNQANPAVDISGERKAITDILALHRRCLVKTTGNGEVTIAYLSNTNSTRYENGTTTAQLNGTHGDWMVYCPRYYYKYQSGTRYNYSFSLTKVDDTWKEQEECLIGVTKAYMLNNKLYSRSGVTPKTAASYNQFVAWAKAKGTGWQIVDYEMHKSIANLFCAKYGTRDAQGTCGAGTTALKATGATASIGNADTSAQNAGSISFLGLENWWGDCFEAIQGVHVPTVGGIALIYKGDYVGKTAPELATAGIPFRSTVAPVDGWIRSVNAGEYADVICTAAGGSSSTYFCDHSFRTSVAQAVGFRSSEKNDATGGVFLLSFAASASEVVTYATVSSRLAFRGIIKIENNPTAFINLPNN